MAAFEGFYRLESPTQTTAIAILQVASREIWGKTPKYGYEPTVEAYAGDREGLRGIEFSTDIQPHPTGSPIHVKWYLTDTPGVEERHDANGEQYACISADVVNFQP